MWDKENYRSDATQSCNSKTNPVLLINNVYLIFSLLSSEHLPKPEGRSSSGQEYQGEGASETQSGGDPRSAQLPGDTTTPASTPTYIPEHPGGAKQSDSKFRFKQLYFQS